MVPGAWHQPIDLMAHIADHSYVMDVTYDDPKTSAVTRSDDEYRDPDAFAFHEDDEVDAVQFTDEQPNLMFHKLKALMGWVGNGSDETVSMGQDDATKGFIVKVGNKTYHSDTLVGAINEAYDDDLDL
jgi:hypothetical protein